MSNRIRALWASSILALAVAACARHGGGVTPRQDLQGEWRIARQASDSVRGSRDRDLRRRSPFGRTTDGRINPQMMDDARIVEAVRETWLIHDNRLHIAINGDDVVMEFADSAVLRFRTNGEKQPQKFRDLPKIETTARWKDGALEVQHYLGRARVLETFRRSENSERLLVDTRILSGLRPIAFKRYYDMMR